MSFASQLAAFEVKTNRQVENIMRYSAFDLFAAIVFMTPIDKGILRGAWFAQIGSGSTKVGTQEDKVGSATVSEIERIIKNVKLDELIFLTNNMPYAVPIEYDSHSALAMDGMVRVNTARWDTIVALNVRRFNK